MKTQFTKEQFKELLLIVMLGVWVRSFVAESREENIEEIEKWEEYFAGVAKQLGYTELYEVFHGKLMPSNDLCLEAEDMMEEYNSETFWEELENRLGRRDFYETMTEKEKAELKNAKWLPDRVQVCYKYYSKEFEKNGINRLRIIKRNKKTKI